MARPFDRPDLDQRKGGLALYITGLLPNAKPLLAYEGRLVFHNAIGDCAADLFGGVLPPGSTVSVDNTAQQIVVTWPAYQAAVAPIENPGFENGDVGWEFGSGWSVTTNNPITGTKSGVFQNARGESLASSKARYPVTPGQSVTASCSVRQGASSSGNAGAAVCLEFRNAAGMVISTPEGNRVMSASNNAVLPSSVTASAPAGVTTVNVAGRGIRKRQNRDVWIDSFAWNVTQPSVGTNVEGTIGPITIRLVDSAGRAAFWTGSIKVGGDQLVWDRTAAGSMMNFTNDDHDVSGKDPAIGGPNWRGVFGTVGFSSGKHQFEIEVMQIADTGINMQTGIATRENTTAFLEGNNASAVNFDTHTEIISYTGWVYKRFGSSPTIEGTATTGAWTTVGKVITIGVDLDASPPTCRYYEDGVLGYTINLPTGKTWYPLGSLYTGYILRIRGANLTHPIPGYADAGG